MPMRPTVPPGRRRPFGLLRTTMAHRRSGAADTVLAVLLAFVAGAINAGGFLAVGQYTSHMTGIVSSVADDVATGAFHIIGAGLVAIAAFMAGAGCSAILINWGRRNARVRQFAYPIALEAVLLLIFGVVGMALPRTPALLGVAAPLLCFIMGLQNATITKISGARMRTTHLTGMITDIGIELGKLAYWNRAPATPDGARVTADMAKLRLLGGIVAMFFTGGIVGGLGFWHLGYVFTVPLSAFLLALSLPQLLRR